MRSIQNAQRVNPIVNDLTIKIVDIIKRACVLSNFDFKKFGKSKILFNTLIDKIRESKIHIDKPSFQKWREDGQRSRSLNSGLQHLLRAVC